jgi:transposase, IS5 family
MFQQKYEKDKIYSLMNSTLSVLPNARHTNVMSGVKASIAMTSDIGIILGALALPENPYDGHTIDVVL